MFDVHGFMWLDLLHEIHRGGEGRLSNAQVHLGVVVAGHNVPGIVSHIRRRSHLMFENHGSYRFNFYSVSQGMCCLWEKRWCNQRRPLTTTIESCRLLCLDGRTPQQCSLAACIGSDLRIIHNIFQWRCLFNIINVHWIMILAQYD